MKALDLNYDYWEQVAKPDFMHTFPELFPRIAAGLVGNGSECFRFDDDLSRDHDWGIDFFLWVLPEDREALPALLEWKEDLFTRFPPKIPRYPTAYAAQVTCMEIGDFYESLIGFREAPQEILDWRLAPEENYALAVNGAVFWDGPGKFSAVRHQLEQYYPEDLRRKKIAARCMAIGQTGQYNLRRMFLREDWVAVHTILDRFVQEVMGLVFHFNRIYRPYYKWQWRRLQELPILGEEIAVLLQKLVQVQGWNITSQKERQEIIDHICERLLTELQAQGLSCENDPFFITQGEAVQRTITHEVLRCLPPQYE